MLRTMTFHSALSAFFFSRSNISIELYVSTSFWLSFLNPLAIRLCESLEHSSFSLSGEKKSRVIARLLDDIATDNFAFHKHHTPK